VLDPFFPQSLEAELAEDTAALLKKGYRTFVVNNPGHFSLLRNSGALLIAGPWLYVFNRWALAFVSGCGADWLISPFENNRQNLERTLPRNAPGQGGRSHVFINVYSRPSLFRIRCASGATEPGAGYNFKNFFDGNFSDRKFFNGIFSDSRGEEFTLAVPEEGSRANTAVVYPEKPFYIGDKISFLKEAGFSRFILDFSDRPVKKAEYRDIINAVENAAHLGGSGRFNWKDGFFKPEEKANRLVQ
jgi:putative protease